jgi:glycosyltransferase involved in cell wall biosynthesis
MELKNDFNYCPSIYFQNRYLSFLLFPVNLFFIALKLLLNRELKIVHIHGSHGGSFIRKYMIYKMAKSIFKKKVVYHVHSSHFHKFNSEGSKVLKRRIKTFINKSDLLIVLSEEWQNYFSSGFNPKRVQILENVVLKQEPGTGRNENSDLKMVFLGRIGNRKGVFDLIDTLKQHKDIAQSKIELVVGGDGEVAKLKNEIKESGLKISYVGWVKGHEKDALIKNSDLFILPSYDEGLPISILEALSFMKPVIATNVGGIPRIVKHEQNGFLVEPGNKEQLWEAIKCYIENPKLLKTHGLKGHEIVQDYFPDKVLSKLDLMYEPFL